AEAAGLHRRRDVGGFAVDRPQEVRDPDAVGRAAGVLADEVARTLDVEGVRDVAGVLNADVEDLPTAPAGVDGDGLEFSVRAEDAFPKERRRLAVAGNLRIRLVA